MKKEVESFLESVWEMCQSEDWDEAAAQDLMMNGAKLYEKISAAKEDHIETVSSILYGCKKSQNFE